MTDTYTVLFVWRCERCAAAFILTDRNETRGGHSKAALLEANTCAACGKGDVEFIGEFWFLRGKDAGK